MAEVSARIITILGIICFIINGLEGSIQSEGTVTTDSVCYSPVTSHVLACPGNAYQIALTSFSYGFKGNSVGCANDGTATGICCEYDSSTDCREEASSGASYMDAFSGRSDGTLATANAAANTCPASTYSAVSIFSELKYQCISDTRIFEMCTSVSYKSTDGSPVYLQNRGYDQGSNIIPSDTSCTCSVEVLSTSTDTTLYTLHMDLRDDPSNCLQSVTLSDGTSNVKPFDCVTSPLNTIQSETLTGNYFSVSFSNSKTTTVGKFWIGFQGSTTTLPIKVNCPAVAKIDCGSLSNPTHGTVTTTGTSFGATATYSCQTNYDVTSGVTSRTCQEDGSWSGSAVVCSYNCGSLGNPVNGLVLFVGTTPGNTATYTCDSDYSLNGNMHRSCIDGSGWNGTVPNCLYDCGSLSNPADGTVAFVGTTSGNTATYTCDSDYSLNGNMHRSCIDGSGWNGAVPNCLYECGSLSNPTNGMVSFTSTTAGSVATYTCNGDPVIGGSGNRTCEAGTGWSGSAPTCMVASHATAHSSTDGSDDNTTIIIIVTVVPLGVLFFIAIIAHVVCYINHIKNNNKPKQDPEATEVDSINNGARPDAEGASHPPPAVSARDVSRNVLSLPRDRTSLPPIRGTASSKAVPRTTSREHTSVSIVSASQIQSEDFDGDVGSYLHYNSAFKEAPVHHTERPDYPYIKEHSAGVHVPDRPHRLEPISMNPITSNTVEPGRHPSRAQTKVLHPSQHVHHPPHRVVESDLHHTSEFDSHCHDYNYHPHPELRAAERTNVQEEPKTRKKKRRK